MTDTQAAAREHMVECQLLPNKVTDPRITAAMGEIPRERFVPKLLRGVAYVDEDIEIAPGRYLMEPRVFGRLLQAADLAASDVVLDVGCASGYSTAVLARLAGTVVALESDEALAAKAGEALSALEIDNAAVVKGALAEGYPSQAPYDAIFLGGAVEEVPAALCDQLGDGGRLLAVVGVGAMGQALSMLRHEKVIARRPLFDAAVPPLPGFRRDPGFVF